MTTHNWKFPLIFFLFLILVGLFSLYVATLLPSETLSVKMLDHLGAALLILGGFGIFEKWAREREILEYVANLFSINESLRKSGLQAVHTDAQHHDFQELVTKSRTLSLVFNDGNKWISSNFAYFDARFKLKNQVTELFLIDPDGPFISVLAQKTGDPVSRLQDKIAQSMKNIREHFERSPEKYKGQLRIYFMPLFPTHTIFLGEDSVVITLYTTSSIRQRVPCLQFTDRRSEEGAYAFFKTDIDHLRDGCKLVYDSSQHGSSQ